MNSKPESLALRNADFFTIYDINVMTEKEATSIDTVLNSVSFLDGENVSFDYLVIATGGKYVILNKYLTVIDQLMNTLVTPQKLIPNQTILGYFL